MSEASSPRWRGALGLGSGFVLLLFWAGVFLRLLRSSSNHLGVSLLWALPLAGVAMLVGGLGWAAGRRGAGAALLALGLVSGVGIVLLDRLNILVQYETWIERGMPERPF